MGVFKVFIMFWYGWVVNRRPWKDSLLINCQSFRVLKKAFFKFILIFVQLGSRSKQSPSLKVWTKMNTQVAFNTTTTHHGKLFDQFQTLVETRYTTKSSQTKPNPNLKKKKSQKKMKPVSGVRPFIGKFNYSFSFETMHKGGQPLDGTMHVSYVKLSRSMNICLLNRYSRLKKLSSWHWSFYIGVLGY